MKKSKTNIERQVSFELTWLFLFSEADCGLKSSWSAMVNAAMVGGSAKNKQPITDPYNQFTLNAIHFRREITDALKQLTISQQNLLYASFGDHHYDFIPFLPEKPPPIFSVYRIYKKLTGAALVSHLTTPDSLISLSLAFHSHKASLKEKLLLSEIRIDAEKNYNDAIKSYYNARQRKNNDKQKRI